MQSQQLKVAVWNAVPQMASAHTGLFLSELKKLYLVQSVDVKDLEDARIGECDLIVCQAYFIDEEHFFAWIQKIRERVPIVQGIRLAAMILCKISVTVQRDILGWAYGQNWYFDLIETDHLQSLPVRVANLLRFSAHLHEVQRMDRALQDVSLRLAQLESQLQTAGVLGQGGKP
jgi:hypothetical protein